VALKKYFGTGNGLLLEEYPNPTTNNPYSYVWPYSQATIASLNLSGIPGSGRAYDAEASARPRASRRTGTPAPPRPATTHTYGRRWVRAATSSTTTTSGSACR